MFTAFAVLASSLLSLAVRLTAFTHIVVTTVENLVSPLGGVVFSALVGLRTGSFL